MKKHLSFLVIIFFLLINQAVSQIVYVTKSGKKFHTENCRYYNNNAIAIDLSEAESKGYTPCKACKPLSSDITTPPDSQTESFNDSDDSSISSSKHTNEKVQCSALTKKGSRCKRMTKSSNGKCWQHGRN